MSTNRAHSGHSSLPDQCPPGTGDVKPRQSWFRRVAGGDGGLFDQVIGRPASATIMERLPWLEDCDRYALAIDFRWADFGAYWCGAADIWVNSAVVGLPLDQSSPGACGKKAEVQRDHGRFVRLPEYSGPGFHLVLQLPKDIGSNHRNVAGRSRQNAPNQHREHRGDDPRRCRHA